ncbi:putative Restriction modification system DNA specificity domain protein [Vibrio diabolicus]|nr:putative Restriction modification system DNA specificity domain protein [Vibrio diabolicus]
MIGFREKKLGEVVTFQRGFDITKKEQTDGDVPIISSSGISSYHNKHKVEGPGVIIGRKGTLGTVHYYPDNFWPHDTTLWVKDFKGNNPRFIYYFLQTLNLENFDTGSSNPTLNRNHIHKIKVLFPEKPIQDKIAAVLSAYDDLVESNKKRIEALENVADEIYREWFVRFRFPGYQDAEFEKGRPKNWALSKVKDLVPSTGLETGKRPKGGAQSEGVVSIGAENVLGLAKYKFNKEKYVPVSFFETMKQGVLQSKDVLFYKDGAEIGRVTLFQDGFPHNKACINEHVFILRSHSGLYQYFLYFYFSQKEVNEYIHLINKNAAQPGINRNELMSVPVFTPNIKLVKKFNASVEPIIKAAFSIAKSNVCIEDTKNTLLKRLVSGRLSLEQLNIQLPLSMKDTTEADVTE